ncbi:MAG TPA: DUF4350 domain-containing protein [Flavobacterium sp.]|jgi:hypothetical protein
MDRSIKIYIGLLLLLIVGIVIIDINKPKPIDWTPTYDTKDKIPLGLYVLDQELPALLKGQKINKIDVTPYEYFEPLYDYDTLVKNYKAKGTFFTINETQNLDQESVSELFYLADHGNSIFLSMKTFPEALLDSLKVNFRSDYQFQDTIFNWMANPRLGNKKYNIVEGVGNNYFSKIDTVNTTVLGYQSGDSARVNFIKVPYKSGYFYLHTQPAAFSNFHLLKKDHAEYAEKVLSYVPKGDVFWYVKNQNGKIESDSMFRFILAQPALRWAWYLFLIGMLIFIIFNAKRRQRIVPIIKPPANTTVEFAKTIGNLYFQEGDHDNIIDKKIIYFLEKVRNDYLMDTTVLDDAFINKLHQKSGKELKDIQRLVYMIRQHRKNNFISIEKDLIDLNDAIEKVTS